MKVVVIGATGFVGKNIVKELSERGHQILGISRKDIQSDHPNVTYSTVDVNDTLTLTDTIKGFDVVISAYNAGWSNPNIYEDFLKGSQSIQKAVKSAGIKRFIVIGGAGSLYVGEGIQLVDTPQFPQEIKPGATASRDYFNLLKEEKDLDWVFFSPAIEIHPGITIGRTGKYRLGTDHPLFDEQGKCVLSVEDVAVVIADEVEQARHQQQRFTAAY